MLSTEALSALFLDARTHRAWTQAPVDDATLTRVYELARMAPTAMNAQPLRVRFVRSPEAKARLEPCLDRGNVDKTMTAPVTAILAYDLAFWERMNVLAPRVNARELFETHPDEAERAARTNAWLQCGYFILAARATGLDCGPMAGFDAAQIDERFFAGTSLRALLLCNLGHGDASKLFARSPRLSFDEACAIE
jgi:3-hydroxypropanoate dehydrogenase